MPGEHNFEHLRLLRRFQGSANIRGGGSTSPQTLANRQAGRLAHGQALKTSAEAISDGWKTLRMEREGQDLPVIGHATVLGVTFAWA